MQNPNQLLLPVFALAALTFFVLFRLGYLRNKAILAKRVSMGYYRIFRGEGEEPPEIVATSRNYLNLFESPVLFYVVMILYYVTRQGDTVILGLAWAFVLCRYLHTVVHIGSNDVRARFAVFALSFFVLLGLWFKLAWSLYFAV